MHCTESGSVTKSWTQGWGFFYFFSTGHIRTIPPGSRLTTHSSHHRPGAWNTLWASLTATGGTGHSQAAAAQLRRRLQPAQPQDPGWGSRRRRSRAPAKDSQVSLPAVKSRGSSSQRVAMALCAGAGGRRRGPEAAPPQPLPCRLWWLWSHCQAELNSSFLCRGGEEESRGLHLWAVRWGWSGSPAPATLSVTATWNSSWA